MAPAYQPKMMTGTSTTEDVQKSTLLHDVVADNMKEKLSDEELISMGEEYYANVRYIDALHAFESISDKSKLSKLHLRIIELAKVAKTNIEHLLLPNPTDQGWKVLKHPSTYGHGKKGSRNSDQQLQHKYYYDTIIYYRVRQPQNVIVSRIETPIKFSLLCPLLSVFNESSLYYKWMPRWDYPVKLGLSESNCIQDFGRGHQIIQARIDTPYPFKHREIYLHPYAVDCIDDTSINAIFVKVDSYDTGEHYEITIPEVSNQYRRAAFDASLLIRPCPSDHPTLRNISTMPTTSTSSEDETSNVDDTNIEGSNKDDDKLLLVTMTLEADGRISNVPLSLINFITRQVIGKQWETLLQIAVDVKDGKRMDHATIIQEKQELYGWINERVQVMLQIAAGNTKVG